MAPRAFSSNSLKTVFFSSLRSVLLYDIFSPRFSIKLFNPLRGYLNVGEQLLSFALIAAAQGQRNVDCFAFAYEAFDDAYESGRCFEFFRSAVAEIDEGFRAF